MPNVSLKEIGGTGTYLVDGYLAQHDYNAEMTGWNRIDIYDKMRKGDGTVRASILAVTLPLVSADWYIKPASEDSKDKEIAEFVEQELFKGQNTWTTKLREILLYLPYGSYVFEKVYKKRLDGKIGWEKFAARLPKTIEKWATEDGKPGITQWLPNGKRCSIPSWKLLTFVNEQEGDNYEGTSILRTAQKHWYFKDKYYTIDALAQERQGLGIPYFKKPPGATPEDIAKAREVMRNLRANEEAYIEMPIGWEFGFVEMEGKSIKSAKDGIDHHNREILLNVLAQFLELGAGATGSKALSQDHSDLFLLSEQAVGKHIAEIINRDAIQELVDLNYTVEKYPELNFGNVGSIDMTTLSNTVTALSGSNLLTANYALEQHLRKSFHLPELTEEEYEKAKKEKEAMNPLLNDPEDPKGLKKKKGSKDGENEDDLEDDLDESGKSMNATVRDVMKFRQNIDAIIQSKLAAKKSTT